MPTCPKRSGSRAVPDLFGEFGSCPGCVNDDGETSVVFGEDE